MIGRASFSYALCGTCGASYEKADACPSCGSALRLPVHNGYILEFPADTVACARCGSDEQTVCFRGWVHLLALVIWSREARKAGYVCRECARVETSKAL